MSDDVVYKGRKTTFHVDRDCPMLQKSDWPVKEISRELADSWDLRPCGHCIENKMGGGHSKWSEFVHETRYGDN